MKLISALLLLTVSLAAQTTAARVDPRSDTYNLRLIARALGNFGRWWGLMNESDKAAFLDGYQEGMRHANYHDQVVCEVIRQSVAKRSNTSIDHFGDIAFVCSEQNATSDYDKVTTKDLDDFYSDATNQFIALEWSLAYLRDKASGKKTAGQLLDALQAEQKALQDCTKYPRMCKAGAGESQNK